MALFSGTVADMLDRDASPNCVPAHHREVIYGVFLTGAYEELLSHYLLRGSLNREYPSSHHVVDERKVTSLLAALDHYWLAVQCVPQPLEYEDLPAHVGADSHPRSHDY